MCASAGIVAILLVPLTASPLLLFVQMCVSAGKVVAFASTHAPAYRPLPFKVPLPCFANVRCELWLWCACVGGDSRCWCELLPGGGMPLSPRSSECVCVGAIAADVMLCTWTVVVLCA